MGVYLWNSLGLSLRATKCVVQPYSGDGLASVLRDCLTITYDAIHYAEEHRIENRKGMKGFYRSLRDTKIPSCYKTASTTRESDEDGDHQSRG